MEVKEESRKLLTISTQKGLFFYNHLPFGRASAPTLFQISMNRVPLRLSFTYCYLDDIHSPNEETHLKASDAVLGHLKEYGLHYKQEKFLLFQDSVRYPGTTEYHKGELNANAD